MLDFYSAEGFLPPSPLVLKYLSSLSWKKITALPDHGSSILRKKLAKFYKIHEENICVSGGISEIINVLPRVFLNKQDAVLVFSPSYEPLFSTNKFSTKKILSINLKEEENFEWQQKTTDDAVLLINKRKDIKIIWLCSPNNPTGAVVSQKEIGRLARNFKGLIVVDEAYMEYIDNNQNISAVPLVKKYKNIFVLRTFSKLYNCAGLRIGYGIGNTRIISAVSKFLLYYGTSGIAQDCAQLALKDQKYLRGCRKEIYNNKKALLKKIKKNLSLRVGSDSKTNLIVLKHKKIDLYNFLKNKGILTKSLSKTPGMPGGYVRIGLRDRKSNAKLAYVLGDLK